MEGADGLSGGGLSYWYFKPKAPMLRYLMLKMYSGGSS